MKTARKHIAEAARAHTNLTIFYAVIAVLEGGTIRGRSADAAASKITRICKAAAGRELVAYDHHTDAAAASFDATMPGTNHRARQTEDRG